MITVIQHIPSALITLIVKLTCCISVVKKASAVYELPALGNMYVPAWYDTTVLSVVTSSGTVIDVFGANVRLILITSQNNTLSN